MSLSIKILNPRLNGGTRSPGVVLDLIVLHSTAGFEADQGSATNAIATLRQRGLSYHYIVTKNGDVIKCLPVSMKAYHAGSSYGPHEKAREISREQNSEGDFTAGTSVNGYSIGISFVNGDDGSDPYPEAQISAGAELIKDLMAANAQLRTITSHAEVSPHRKIDPNAFNIQSFADKVGLTYWSH